MLKSYVRCLKDLIWSLFEGCYHHYELHPYYRAFMLPMNKFSLIAKFILYIVAAV